MNVAKIKTSIDIMAYGMTTTTLRFTSEDFWFDALDVEFISEHSINRGPGRSIIKFKKV